jgi:hypothetical protein
MSIGKLEANKSLIGVSGADTNLSAFEVPIGGLT